MAKPITQRSPRGRPSATVVELQQEIATTQDGNDVTRPFVKGIVPSSDARLNSAIDWGIYKRVLIDDQVMSTLQQRRTAVVSRQWSVISGDDADPRANAAAEAFSKTLKRIGWDRITDKMLFAIFHGYSVAEIIWQYRDGLLDFGAIKVRNARRFRYDDEGQLRLLKRNKMAGEPLPGRKFWVHKVGGADDDEPYGRGIAEWLYWPVTFKRNGLRFWNIFLDKFGSPTALGKYRPGTPKADVQKLLAALSAIATDSGVAIPEGMAIELLQAARSGTADYATMCRYMDGAISKVVLSQTMTTDDGASLSQANVHAGVKLEVIKSDADLMTDSFCGEDGPARWWTDVNFGPDVAAPIVQRDTEEEADLSLQAETDTKMKGLGWERTDESHQEVYGEGYQRVKAPADPSAAKDAKTPAGDAQPVPANDQKPTDPTASFAADDPRTLYVYRPLLNPEDVIAWAREQGFASTLAAEDLHVTITYSKTPVNWMLMGGFWGWGPDTAQHLVPPGGPRLVEQLGDNAVAIVFTSGHLEQRHKEMRAAGTSWDYSSYLPHVTISYDPGDIDLAKVTPYRGELRFGPEVFEELDPDWQANVQEVSFADPPADRLTTPDDGEAASAAYDDEDRVIDEYIARHGYDAVAALTAPMLAAVRQAGSVEELEAAIAAMPGDTMPLSQAIENASFAMRIGAESVEP